MFSCDSSDLSVAFYCCLWKILFAMAHTCFLRTARSDSVCVAVCNGDGSKVGSAAFAGGSSRSRQSAAAQPAGGREEVGGQIGAPVQLNAIQYKGFTISL